MTGQLIWDKSFAKLEQRFSGHKMHPWSELNFNLFAEGSGSLLLNRFAVISVSVYLIMRWRGSPSLVVMAHVLLTVSSNPSFRQKLDHFLHLFAVKLCFCLIRPKIEMKKRPGIAYQNIR